MTIIALILFLFFPSCATEDSTSCYWDASVQGNGQGRSFIALTDSIIYL